MRSMPLLLWLGRHVDLRGARRRGRRLHVPVPYGVDVAPDGSVWFSQLNEHRIGRVDPETLRDRDDRHALRAPRRLRFDSKGGLWIPGFSSGLIARFDPKTREFRSYELPIEPRGSETPYALHVDRRSGRRLDLRHQQRHADPLRAGDASASRCTRCRPASTYTREIDFDAEGRVWTSNSNAPAWQIEGGMPRVLRLDPDGGRRPLRWPFRRAGLSELCSASGSLRDRFAVLRSLKLAGLASRLALAIALAGLGCERPGAPIDYSGPVAGWPPWGGDAGGSRHSPLTQIDARERGPPRARLELPHRRRRRRRARTRGKSVFEATPILDGDDALLLLAVQPRLRARRRDRPPALGLRSEGRARAPLAAHLPRRRALERSRARSAAQPCRRRDLHRHDRRAPARARRRERRALCATSARAAAST